LQRWHDERGTPVLVAEGRTGLARFAFETLELAGRPALEIDDVEAEEAFADACAPLFALHPEFAAGVDPEVAGLRTPQRFLESAFRLIRRLRDARIAPDAFLQRSLSAAADFYSNPPNFADTALLLGVKASDHPSLGVTPDELQRQYRREVDLAKILAALYERYAQAASYGRMTGRDAVHAAIEALDDAGVRARVQRRYAGAFVDEAETLTAAERDLLTAAFGTELHGVTLCGRRAAVPESAIRAELSVQHRSPPAIDAACRRLMGLRETTAASAPRDALQLFRAPSRREEAAFVAAAVRDWIDAGTPPEKIGVLLRSMHGAEPYERALLERNVAVVPAGDLNVFADRRALDALALLWNVYDPFAHDWLLRTLSNPAMGLSDASLSLLCGEPADPQASLFVLNDEPPPTSRPGRWDPKRDLRLGWNVVRGDRDGDLHETARERLVDFRAKRLRWIEAMQRAPFETFARLVWGEGLALEGEPGSARAAAQQIVLRRILDRLNAYLAEVPDRTVGDALRYARRRAGSGLESCEDADGFPGVRLIDVEAARGREFDRIAVVDVRAGAFPRWYAPEAFAFSPRSGMISRENTGEARVGRTAKFTYYMWKSRAREHYNTRERERFCYALRRARVSALVTAWGSATRGVSAPEFLEELRGLG
jgi:superfamily I DNA/RNA helicase